MKTIVDLQQINFLDERFYTMDDINFFPSVTYILDCYPKGFGFQQWLKDLGSNADQVRDRAAAIGTKVHNAVNKLLLGEELTWDDGIYNLDEWQYILKFVEFWKIYKPELISTEDSLISPELGFAGTIDLVCKIGNDVWLIDLKTSNYLSNSYELQVAAYRKLWDAQSDYKIQRAGIFWFKAQTRGADKEGKSIQGEGWQLKEYEGDGVRAYRLFEAVLDIWKNENPNPKPKNRIYPIKATLNL
jgi:hypothetical protein